MRRVTKDILGRGAQASLRAGGLASCLAGGEAGLGGGGTTTCTLCFKGCPPITSSTYSFYTYLPSRVHILFVSQDDSKKQNFCHMGFSYWFSDSFPCARRSSRSLATLNSHSGGDMDHEQHR